MAAGAGPVVRRRLPWLRARVVLALVSSALAVAAGASGASLTPPDMGTAVAPAGSPVARPSASPAAGAATPGAEGTTMADLEACIVGRWLHSHEEDTADAQVYRPADFDFPPARGRDGFEFRPGGDLVYLGIARADGTEESNGRWALEPPNRIRIEVEHERIEPFTIAVVSCDDAALQITR